MSPHLIYWQVIEVMLHLDRSAKVDKAGGDEAQLPALLLTKRM